MTILCHSIMLPVFVSYCWVTDTTTWHLDKEGDLGILSYTYFAWNGVCNGCSSRSLHLKMLNDNSSPLKIITCVCFILLSHWYHHMTFGQGGRSRNLDVKLRIHGGCIYVGWRTSSIVSRPKMEKVGRLKKRNYIVALTGCPQSERFILLKNKVKLEYKLFLRFSL